MPDIIFIQDYYEMNLGIMSISAVLKQHGFSTDVVMGLKEDIVKQVVKIRPKVVGFYCTTGFHHKHLFIAKEVKRILGDGIIAIFGGPHPTFDTSLIEEEGVDIVCRGEGEYAVLELMQAIKKRDDYAKIRNLTVKKKGGVYENELRPLGDLDLLPHPDREIYKSIPFIYNIRRQSIMFSRGCPFNCSFCSSPSLRKLYQDKGNYVRLRSIQNVIEELEYIKRYYKPACFHIFDEVFFLKKDYYKELLFSFKHEISLPYSCMMRADLLTDDVAMALKETGCYFVGFGIESGNEKIRNFLLTKKLSNGDILLCAKLLHKYNIPFVTYNMIGLPGEKLSDVWDTVNLNAQLKPNWARFAVYQSLPNTELARHPLNLGYDIYKQTLLSDATCYDSSILVRNNKEGGKIIKLKCVANLFIRFPSIKKFIGKIIINLPFEWIYMTLEKLFSFLVYQSKMTYKQGFFEASYIVYFLINHRKEFE